MSSQLTDKELAELLPSEMLPHHTPVPTQMVSSDEFYPAPQNARQREVEARLLSMADDLGGKQGLDRRKFFQTAAGMAASFLAMNEVFGNTFRNRFCITARLFSWRPYYWRYADCWPGISFPLKLTPSWPIPRCGSSRFFPVKGPRKRNAWLPFHWKKSCKAFRDKPRCALFPYMACRS